jgi:hypothetical protein
MPNRYNTQNLLKPQSFAEIGRDIASLKDVIGFDVHKKGNLHLIENDVLVYAVGSSVVFHYISTNTKEHLMGIDESGVSCVALHPSR